MASLSAINIFAEKSALLCPLRASETFAPMLVPLRSNYFERTNSFFSADKCYTMQINNSYCKIEWFVFNNVIVHWFLHSAFCIMNSSLAFVLCFYTGRTPEAVLTIELGSFGILRIMRFYAQRIKLYHIKLGLSRLLRILFLNCGLSGLNCLFSRKQIKKYAVCSWNIQRNVLK